MNSINYIILDDNNKVYINSPDLMNVYKLEYISSRGRLISFIIGIYKPELVDEVFIDGQKKKRILSLDEIIEEISSLNLNAQFVKKEIIR